MANKRARSEPQQFSNDELFEQLRKGLVSTSPPNACAWEFRLLPYGGRPYVEPAVPVNPDTPEHVPETVTPFTLCDKLQSLQPEQWTLKTYRTCSRSDSMPVLWFIEDLPMLTPKDMRQLADAGVRVEIRNKSPIAMEFSSIGDAIEILDNLTDSRDPKDRRKQFLAQTRAAEATRKIRATLAYLEQRYDYAVDS